MSRDRKGTHPQYVPYPEGSGNAHVGPADHKGTGMASNRKNASGDRGERRDPSHRNAASATSNPNLILIGYRGCGKTSVGRIVAQRLGRPFVDADERIEQAAGRSIREIFDTEGEAAFRTLEADVIFEIIARSGQVVSVGGGAVLDDATRRALRRYGLCVWLTAPPDELHRRLQADPRSVEQRPALTGLAPLAEIEGVLNERIPIYESMADCIVDTRGRGVEELAGTIADWLRARLASRTEQT